MANSMGDAFWAGEKQSADQQTAQIAAAIADLEARGFDKVKGPIMQLAQTRSKPGRRNDLLKVLAKFEKHVTQEDGTLFYGHFPDLEDPELVHCFQVYENWEALRHHMVQEDYFQYLDDILDASVPSALTYQFGSSLFMHQGKGTGT